LKRGASKARNRIRVASLKIKKNGKRVKGGKPLDPRRAGKGKLFNAKRRQGGGKKKSEKTNEKKKKKKGIKCPSEEIGPKSEKWCARCKVSVTTGKRAGGGFLGQNIVCRKKKFNILWVLVRSGAYTRGRKIKKKKGNKIEEGQKEKKEMVNKVSFRKETKLKNDHEGDKKKKNVTKGGG